MNKLLALLVIAGAATLNVSCDVNDYCLNCATGDGGGGDGGSNDDGGVDDGDLDDGNGDGGCTNTGPEVCDGDDNDCDGATDEGQLPTIGDLCDNQMGECQGGVKQCTGGVVTCSRPAVPEICDLKDNDCNGLTDEGDPGGGATCGTNTGECVAGANRCISGSIQCVGAVGPNPAGESCNNRDDDCDGSFDENLTLGPCVAGDDGPAQGNQGECSLGMRQCIGGVTTCVGAAFPVFELCDQTNLDQDCDGQPSNGYNLNTDPQNCGGCGNVCNLPNAFEGCGPPGVTNGQCKVVACAPNFFNNDGIHANGCEFNCGHPLLGNEVCNGIDDDCDGLTDMMDPDLVAPVGLCDDDGACATNTVLSCDGMAGWRCHYNNPNVQVLDPGAGMNTMIAPETRCDSDLFMGAMAGQADNDCDGRIDEGQANLGDACDNSMVGVCRSSGSYVCNTANRTAAAVCQFTQVGMAPQAERCDGLDNNCNNQIDEGAATGDLPGQEWVTIPGITPAVEIMKYEASRPDATALANGSVQSHACSRPDILPWTNITYPQAEDACNSVGARLCTEAEWQSMCMPATTYPAAGVPVTTGTATTEFTFIEAEDAFANTPIGGAGRAWSRTSPITLNGVTAMQVPDNGFAENNAASALANSSRLDYRVNLLGAQSYRVFLRMRSPNLSSVTGVHTTPTATLAPVADATTAVGDLVVVSTFTRATSGGIPTHTLQSGFTQISTQSLDDGSNDGRMSIAYRVVTTAGAQTYQAYTASGGTSFSGIYVLRAGRYNTANLLSAATSSTSGNPPDSPATTAVASDSIVLSYGGWHFSTSQTMNTTAPAGYTEIWEALNSNSSEHALAAALAASGTTPNPPAFTDNQGNVNGTIAITVTIGLQNIASNSVWVGLNAGGTAGAANGGTVATSAPDQWQWVVSPALTSGAAGLHTFSIYTREDGVLVDTIAIARHTTNPTFDNAWAYETNPRTAQPMVCNGDELDTDTVAAGDQDGIVPTGSLDSCFANQTGTADAFDMSGNVKEWTVARNAGQNPMRGGASNNLVTGLTCQLSFTLADDDFFFPNVGFRCCRD